MNKILESSLLSLLPQLSNETLQLLELDLKIRNLKKYVPIKKNVETKKNEPESESEEFDENNIIFFTDGCCKNNGSKDAKGAFGVYVTDDRDSKCYKYNNLKLINDEIPTNQKAELLAIKQAFMIIYKFRDELKNKKMIICSDSLYSINCLTKWYKNWIKNNWKTVKNEPVKNMEILQDIIKLKDIFEKNGYDISFKHVNSHMQTPEDTSSYKYKLWYGNYKIDYYLNKIVENK